jgi:hypothetical protein
MATLEVQKSTEDRYSVYCGSGVYVSCINVQKQHPAIVHTGEFDKALHASRAVAVAALHTARRAGLNAWIVNQPCTAS